MEQSNLMRDLAERGAKLRVQELLTELDYIRREFPGAYSAQNETADTESPAKTNGNGHAALNIDPITTSIVQPVVKRGPGRPRKTVTATPATAHDQQRKRSVMSEEGKARIAAAQRARWAKLKAEKQRTKR